LCKFHQHFPFLTKYYFKPQNVDYPQIKAVLPITGTHLSEAPLVLRKLDENQSKTPFFRGAFVYIILCNLTVAFVPMAQRIRLRAFHGCIFGTTHN